MKKRFTLLTIFLFNSYSLLYSIEIKDGLYVYTLSLQEVGLNPRELQKFWVINGSYIHELGFECTGPGCKDFDGAHHIYKIIKHIDNNKLQLEHIESKTKMTFFYLSSNTNQIGLCMGDEEKNRPFCRSDQLTRLSKEDEAKFFEYYNLGRFVKASPGSGANNRKTYIATTTLRLRKGPSTSTKQVGRVPKGARVTFLEDAGHIETIDKKKASWFKVRTQDGKVGYVFSGFLLRE